MTELSEHRYSPEALEDIIISRAFKKAEKHLERNRIDTKNFKSSYSDEEITGDEELVRRLAKKFHASWNIESRLGVVFEAILSEHIELSDWLGQDTITKKTSLFDDFVNGVDEIIEYPQDLQTDHLPLAIDITYGGEQVLKEKLLKIQKDIQDGKFSEIKYFEDYNGNHANEPVKMPKALLAIDREMVIELALMWVEGNKKRLAEHPVQIQILDELLIQLEMWREYALQCKKTKIAGQYEKQISTLRKIIHSDAKQALIKKYGFPHRRESRAYNVIKEFLSKINKSQEDGL